jgi:hypothetical protein
MNDNRLLAVAAGVVFYGLLAVFPAITAFVSLYGLMADPSTIHERLSLATGVLPQGALNILDEQLTRLTSHRTPALRICCTDSLARRVIVQPPPKSAVDEPRQAMKPTPRANDNRTTFVYGWLQGGHNRPVVALFVRL